MKGAREYADLFNTKQYGKLYIVSSEHARGKTFSIYVLPEGEVVEQNGRSNPPLNKDAICVYGVLSGNPGWTETYGWLHRGAWVNDFEKLTRDKQLAREERDKQHIASASEKVNADRKRELEILERY